VNETGRLFRFSIFGESHGPVVGGVVDGCPAGIPLAARDFEADIARRKPGAAGTTARAEADSIELLSGTHRGFTTGAPITFVSRNADTNSSSYEGFTAHPRPGHADFVARVKYRGFADMRGSGHFSGRLSLPIVAAGVIAKKLLPQATFASVLLEAGAQTGSEAIERAIALAQAEGDSVGGIVECRVRGLPAGLGEPFFGGVESLVASALFAIPGVRGVEFGDGFRAARMRGSAHNDPIVASDGGTARNGAGGVNGGITNGNELVVRLALKPTSSVAKSAETWNFELDRLEGLSATGRHDACFARRVPVIAEAAIALALADLILISRANQGVPHDAT